MTLAEKIEEFLLYYSSQPARSTDESYQSIFSDEGLRKARYIIDDVEKKVARFRLDPQTFSILSIGGADGSEIEALLKATGIPRGILLEMSSSACEVARRRAISLKQQDKLLDVKEGDALSRLDEALESMRAQGVKGIVISAQAILHELPSRSKAYSDDNRLLGRLFSAFPITLFYAREPCSPRLWPKEVEFCIPGVKADRLCRLLKMVGSHFRLPVSGIQELPGDFVIADSVLVVEVLHKLLRSKSAKEFEYEMGEQLTSFDSDRIERLLIKFCDDPSFVTTQLLATEGFHDSYQTARIIARDPVQHVKLRLPYTHVLFHAIRIGAEVDGEAAGEASGGGSPSRPPAKNAKGVGGKESSGVPQDQPVTRTVNWMSDCAELEMSSTQGSSRSLFDLAPVLRFGRQTLALDGMDIEYGLTEAVLKLTSSACVPGAHRLGDDLRTSFVASEAGNKWRINGPLDPNGTLSRNPLGGETLCQMHAVDESAGPSASLTLECMRHQIKYSVRHKQREEAISATKEAILGAFLNKCGHDQGQMVKLSQTTIAWDPSK